MDEHQISENEKAENAFFPVPEAGTPGDQVASPLSEEEKNSDEQISANDPSADTSAPQPANSTNQQKQESPDLPNDSYIREELHKLNDLYGAVSKDIDEIAHGERKLFEEVREMHRLYHGEFTGRLRTMQEELDRYHKVDRGRAYDEILGAIAQIYGNNETLPEEIAEPRAKKSAKYMLMEIADLLTEYGVTLHKTPVGEKRSSRFCQIQTRISTENPDLHNTIAKSYNTGFSIEGRPIIKETVDVYCYEKEQHSQSIGTFEEDITTTNKED